jgi:hypothetical protein
MVTDKTTSEFYIELLPILNSRRAELLDHSQLVSQLCQLERYPTRGGKDKISHPPGGHDDIINAVAGAIVKAQASAKQEPKKRIAIGQTFALSHVNVGVHGSGS